MKSLLALILLASAAQAQIPDDLVGTWRTGARDGSWGYVRIEACGTLYCGTLIDGGGAHVDPTYFGTLMIEGMAWNGSEFTDGRLLDVERHHWYAARIRFHSRDSIQVDGCVLARLLCAGQLWTRAR